MSNDPTIIYTLTDEAPLLATHAFLPVVRTFTKPAGIRVDEADISVAARILANFPEFRTEEQRVPDVLSE
ncbi:MAG TPA: NADP-dependent isocitrate dehydrogenase, partial [Pseudoduganella sp.]